MISKEYTNLIAERQYREYEGLIIQEVENFSEIFESAMWRYSPNQDKQIRETLMLRIRRIFRAQMYRVLLELYSDDTKFDQIRDSEWWTGDMRDKWRQIGKDNYVPVTKAVCAAIDIIFADPELRFCIPKCRVERENEIEIPTESEEIKEQK